MMADLVIGHLQHLIAGLQERPAAELSQPLDADQQPFLLDGNWGHTDSACVLEADLPEMVTANRGWQWVDEGKTREQHKRGYVSVTPGSQLALMVCLPPIYRSFLGARVRLSRRLGSRRGSQQQLVMEIA